MFFAGDGAKVLVYFAKSGRAKGFARAHNKKWQDLTPHSCSIWQTPSKFLKERLASEYGGLGSKLSDLALYVPDDIEEVGHLITTSGSWLRTSPAQLCPSVVSIPTHKPTIVYIL